MKKSTYWVFAAFWILDAALLYFAHGLYPAYFVLGSKTVGFWTAIILSSLVWTFLVWISASVVDKLSKLKGKVLMFGFYFLVNFFALWLTARLAPYLGLGTPRFTWLVYLALAADVAQYALWKVGSFKKLTK